MYMCFSVSCVVNEKEAPYSGPCHNMNAVVVLRAGTDANVWNWLDTLALERKLAANDFSSCDMDLWAYGDAAS